MSVIVCSEKELRPHTRHADTHTAHAVSEWGVVRGCWGGQSFSRANQIQWRQRQSRLPACPSASQPACLLSAIFRSPARRWQFSSLHGYRSQLVIQIFITATAVCPSMKLQLNNQMIFFFLAQDLNCYLFSPSFGLFSTSIMFSFM